MYRCTFTLACESLGTFAVQKFVVEAIKFFATGEVDRDCSAALSHLADVDRRTERGAKFLFERNQMLPTRTSLIVCIICFGLL